jgi:glycosyltransferase involved in cell wall biosynthesis
VIKDGVTGILVPPKDVVALQSALTRLLDDRDLRIGYGVAAEADARERFNWDRHLETLMCIYQEVTSHESRVTNSDRDSSS